MDHAIEVTGLRKRYGSFEAVRGVSFEVAAGQVFCILGPNGAGKTTTVEILEGYRLADEGTVTVLGEDPTKPSRRLRERVGVVLQETGLQDNLTVGEVLEMYRRYYPHPLGVEEVIGLVELDAKRDGRVGELSGGQRRRLDVALALVGDPDLIFLDEPTTGFDPHARRNAWGLVQSLTGLGKTVVLTTHYMDEAQALADRIAVMVGGEIVATGTPEQLGGRDTLPAEIRFRLPEGMGADALPSLGADDARVCEDRGGLLVTTGSPVSVTHALTGWALERDVHLAGFAVAQPTLEDVYLQLTTTDTASEEVPA